MTLLEKMKFYIVVPQAATNLVTNPTPYRVMTGYTAYDAGGGTTIAASDTYTRRAPKCIKVSAAANEAGGVYFSTVSVTNGGVYAFSVDVKGVDGEAMRIKVEDAGATYTYTTTFTATGNWQRVSVTFTGEEDASDYRLYVIRDSQIAATDFYVDGFQYETTEVTTFFNGDSQGFGVAPLEFYWGGTPHASVSYRTKDTRAGGVLLDIEDYAYEIIATAGLGMGNFTQIYNELANGGAYYQKHVRKPRNFSIIVHYHGSTPGELHDARATIIEAIRPDYTGYDQPLVIRYQGEDVTGNDATQPIDIICIPQYSHESLPDEPINNRDILNFTVLDGHLAGAYKEGKELGLYDTLPVGGCLIYRDADGVWHDVANGANGIGQAVYTLAEAPNGDIYIGGYFANAGNVAEADYLCKWDGSAITAVVPGFTGGVEALCFDAAGNLYIGGLFTDAGSIAEADCIAKWDGASLTALGTGAQGTNQYVSALAIDPMTGYLYAGGNFTTMGGVAGTANIAYWDGTAWNPLSTGLNSTVLCLMFGPDGNLYIGGNFTNADGANGDYICYWDGSSFHRIGSVELNSAVLKLTFDDSGYLYAGGAFTNAGGDANADYIARIKLGAEPSTGANTWEALGTGVNNFVYDIAVDDSDIYVSGEFTIAGGISIADKVAVYKNGAWGMLNVIFPGIDRITYTFVSEKKELYIGTKLSGAAYTNDSVQITNSGNTNVYPTIEMTGPGVVQSITNYTTGKEVQFDGLTLQAGEIVTLKLDPIDIQMTSTWAGRGNLLKYINPGSDLGQFYLRPGTNYISFFMPSGTTAATKAYIYFTPKFWSLEGSRYE